jgi:hypothetical protein
VKLAPHNRKHFSADLVVESTHRDSFFLFFSKSSATKKLPQYSQNYPFSVSSFNMKCFAAVALLVCSDFETDIHVLLLMALFHKINSLRAFLDCGVTSRRIICLDSFHSTKIAQTVIR